MPSWLSFCIWVWVKIKPPGDRRFESLFPFTRASHLGCLFDPQPNNAQVLLELGIGFQDARRLRSPFFSERSSQFVGKPLEPLRGFGCPNRLNAKAGGREDGN